MMRKKQDSMTTERLLALHEGASQAGGPDRETFVALWERASAVGENATALFTWMVNQPESWAWLRDDERRRAQARLRDFDDAHPKGKVASQVKKPESSRGDGRLEKYRRGWSERVHRPPAEAFLVADSIAKEHDLRIEERRRREWVSWIASGVVVLFALAWAL